MKTLEKTKAEVILDLLHEQGVIVFKKGTPQYKAAVQKLAEYLAIPDPEIEPTFVTSTNSVSGPTAEWLNANIGLGNWLIVYDKKDVGWWVRVPQDDTPEELKKRYENVPKDLQKVIEHARKRGCSWVMFDEAADVADGLKEYNW